MVHERPSGDRRTVVQGGRAKAYRPLPEGRRQEAFEAGLAAYERDEWFEAHELLEPAWMGTDDLPERDLCQGLIKLAAAHVHRQRGNPTGMRKNLIGARARLAAAVEGGVDDRGLDLSGLLGSIDDRLAALDRLGDGDVALIPPIALDRRA
jgi:predicted metal-dependent hydrolase